jgi:hypothetical protein
MNWAESLVLGCGMNARGSTEIIVATIGLSMGVLNQSLFTPIVAMAVATTMSMPPMLRWALGRLPMSDEEKERLEREEFEATNFVANIERMLVAVDASPSGQLASRLAGLIAGVRRLTTTVIHFDYEPDGPLYERKRQADQTRSVVQEHAAEGGEAGQGMSSGGPAAAITTRVEKDEMRRSRRRPRKGMASL